MKVKDSSQNLQSILSYQSLTVHPLRKVGTKPERIDRNKGMNIKPLTNPYSLHSLHSLYGFCRPIVH